MSPFYDPFSGFDFMFSIVPIFFIFIFGVIVFTVIKNISESMHNNKQPIIPVEAKVVTKRYDVTHHHHHHADNHHHHSSSTSYYATFEMTNGERMELRIPSNEFGMMVEGDTGILQFQGTRFISFNR